MTRTRPLAAALAGMLLAAAASPAAAAEERTLTLMTHDSFFLPEAVIESFEQEHAVDLQLLPAGDAGSMVNQAILTADRPLADVLFGVDNTFLSRALEADIFEPYRSPELATVRPELVLDPAGRVTPIDFGDVCLNIDRAALEAAGLEPPERLEDLTDPALAQTLVVENPATSSPGLAFLLATVAYFGERSVDDRWQDFWAQLRDGGVEVTAGWEEAYYGSFSGGGEGDNAIVVSYATSPAAEVIFGDDPDATEAPTRAVDSGCFRQIEFAGILAGTDEPELSAALIDHLLSPEVQAELPMAMFVYPARADVELPEAFRQHAIIPESSVTLSPDVIAAKREEWISEWTDIVLR